MAGEIRARGKKKVSSGKGLEGIEKKVTIFGRRRRQFDFRSPTRNIVG